MVPKILILILFTKLPIKKVLIPAQTASKAVAKAIS